MRARLLTFTYDSGGNQLTAATSGSGTGQPNMTLTSGYNSANDRTSLADNYSAQRTTFTYDLPHRLQVIKPNGNVTITFTYDNVDNVKTIVRKEQGTPNKTIITTMLYDAANKLTTITDGFSTTMLATFVYGYDSGGRVTMRSTTARAWPITIRPWAGRRSRTTRHFASRRSRPSTGPPTARRSSPVTTRPTARPRSRGRLAERVPQ